LQTLGRDLIDGVVDAVFVTVGGKNALSMQRNCLRSRLTADIGSRYPYINSLP